eukprot:m.105874 g.105874  ORF g.105874 m.105874 type:complete len:225 (-) comp22512_c0_seq5:136-810(-)
MFMQCFVKTPLPTRFVTMCSKAPNSTPDINAAMPPNSQLHTSLDRLALLVGTWSGEGHGKYPTVKPFAFDEIIEFTHVGKPFIVFSQKTWQPEMGSPMHTESGYIRATPAGGFEAVISDPTGLAQVYDAELSTEGKGKLTLKLVSKSIARTSTAKDVSEVVRVWTLENNTLHILTQMKAMGQELQDHIASTLQRKEEAVTLPDFALQDAAPTVPGGFAPGFNTS